MAKISLALLTTRAPDPLAQQLTLAGYIVHEALWADEVFQLMDTEHVDVAVIKTGVDDAEIPELQKRLMSLVLESGATAADVIWELSQLFPHQSSVQ